MKLRTVIELPIGMRSLFANLELSSSLSSHILLEREMSVSISKIASVYIQLKETLNSLSLADNYKQVSQLKESLCGVRDIRNTLNALMEGKIPDDIELFEIKNLALLSDSLIPVISIFSDSFPKLPDLSGVVTILDPEGQKIPSFYIYDCYDSELSKLRKKLKSLDIFDEDLYSRCSLIEDRIRKEIGNSLKGSLPDLIKALNNLAEIDVIIAKAELVRKWNLTIPVISKDRTSYQGLFNPEISSALSLQGLEYQPVDVSLERESPVVLIGANMGGKSVTLRTLALSQYMFQFGFGVPAKYAEIVPVHFVHYLSGDYQDVNKGLSSFAAEMRNIDNLLKQSKETASILALLDEPARTTNPYEGRVLVESLITMINNRKLLTLIATHYNITANDCLKLRVRGFVNGKMNYELIHTDDSDAPREAINIAKSLGIDSEWMEEASRLLDNYKETI